MLFVILSNYHGRHNQYTFCDTYIFVRPYVNGRWKLQAKKIKLISFKGSEHIIEKGDGPYRGFGLLKSRQCVDYVWLPL